MAVNRVPGSSSRFVGRIAAAITWLCCTASAEAADKDGKLDPGANAPRPNIVLVITDDK